MILVCGGTAALSNTGTGEPPSSFSQTSFIPAPKTLLMLAHVFACVLVVNWWTITVVLDAEIRRALLVYTEAVRVMARSVRQSEASVASDAFRAASPRPFLVLMTEAQGQGR